MTGRPYDTPERPEPPERPAGPVTGTHGAYPPGAAGRPGAPQRQPQQPPRSEAAGLPGTPVSPGAWDARSWVLLDGPEPEPEPELSGPASPAERNDPTGGPVGAQAPRAVGAQPATDGGVFWPEPGQAQDQTVLDAARVPAVEQTGVTSRASEEPPAPEAFAGPPGKAVPAPDVPAPEVPVPEPHTTDPTADGDSSPDPVRRLLRQHRELCQRAVDPLEIAAGLEAHGVTDRIAAKYRHRDVFSLAEELYVRAPGPTQGAVSPATPPGAPGASWPAAATRLALGLLPGALCAATLLGLAGLPESVAPPLRWAFGGCGVLAVLYAGWLALWPRPGGSRPRGACGAGERSPVRSGACGRRARGVVGRRRGAPRSAPPPCARTHHTPRNSSPRTGDTTSHIRPGGWPALCWLTGYALYGDWLLVQVLAGGPEPAEWPPTLGCACVPLTLTLAVAPAVGGVLLFAAHTRRGLRGGHGLGWFTARSRPLLAAVLAGYAALLVTLHAAAGLAVAGRPPSVGEHLSTGLLGMLLFLAFLLVHHGRSRTALVGLYAGCALQATAYATVLGARLPGMAVLGRPVERAVAEFGTTAVPVIAFVLPTLALLTHVARALPRASTHRETA